MRKTIARLVIGAVVLPIALSVCFGVGQLLNAMNDVVWAGILFRICLLGAIIWVVNLICLLVALGFHAVGSTSDSRDSSEY